MSALRKKTHPNSISFELAILATAIVIAFSVTSSAQPPAPPTVEQAVEMVNCVSGGRGNMSGSELQTYCRLRGLIHYDRYQYAPAHAETWLKCLQDETKHTYGRLCAAYFLLDEHEEARDFVELQLKSENLRYRYNAAQVVQLYVGTDTKKSWGVDVLIRMVADGSLDGSGVNRSPKGIYPQGDRDDIMATPLNSICIHLGVMQEKKAVPALISLLQRRPVSSGATLALGRIGDMRATAILMKLLDDRTGDTSGVVTSLGQLKHKEAVPILIAGLKNPSLLFGEISLERELTCHEVLLEALENIGDSRAIEPIEQYLLVQHPPESQATAKRALVRLKSPDPAGGLIELFHQETLETARADIIDALSKYPDKRVVIELNRIASTSESAFLRREAIFGLGRLSSRESLLALAALLDLTWPKSLKAEYGWRLAPDFGVYFPEIVETCLKQSTQQDLGRDRVKWEAWIQAHVE